MTQDLEQGGEDRREAGLDASSDLDLVTIFHSSNLDSELEANSIHSVLQAAGVPSVLVGTSVIPSLAFEVQVPRARLEEAERLLEEARAAGPEAAEEAEAQSESQ
jgi:hypothetical protein